MTYADFIEAIAASPADDTPRLACADWLEENGEPDRADIIRSQCAAERRRFDGPLLDRNYAVRERNPEWTSFAMMCAWERGFIWFARVAEAVWQSRATEIVSSLAPLLSCLILDVGPVPRDTAPPFPIAVFLPERHRITHLAIVSGPMRLSPRQSVQGQTGTLQFTVNALRRDRWS
jgi:uncharacterized protein (TIGR02996 family)